MAAGLELYDFMRTKQGPRSKISILGARTLLVAPGLTSNKEILVTKGIATSSFLLLVAMPFVTSCWVYGKSHRSCDAVVLETLRMCEQHLFHNPKLVQHVLHTWATQRPDILKQWK